MPALKRVNGPATPVHPSSPDHGLCIRKDIPENLKNLRATDDVGGTSSTQGILEFHYSDEHRSVTDRSRAKVSAELHE